MKAALLHRKARAWLALLVACGALLTPTLPVLGQEQFFTQSGGRGLQNAKTNARLSKAETEIGVMQEDLRTIKPHARAELGACAADGEKLRFDGTNWVCDQETDPTVQAFAKKALPTCTGGNMLGVVGGELGCSQVGFVTQETDPTVQEFAKQPLPQCASEQLIAVGANNTLRCITDQQGIATETDPRVYDFAKRDAVSVLPNCPPGELLTMVNGRLGCRVDQVGLSVEVDPQVQDFARKDNGQPVLAACANGEVLRATTQGGKVVLACENASGALTETLALNDLSDVITTGQTSGSALTYSNGYWRAMPTLGSAANPLYLSQLGDVQVSSAQSDDVLRWDGTRWVNSNDKLGTLTDTNWCRTVGTEIVCDRPPPLTCNSGELLSWDGTSNTWLCTDAATSIGNAIELNDLGDVSITSVVTGQALRFDGTGWVNSTIERILAGDTQIVATDTGTDGLLSFATDGVTRVAITNEGRVGVGVMPASPYMLDVSGSIRASGDITATNIYGQNGLFNGDLTVRGNLNVSGSQSIDGVIFANGGVALSGTLASGNVSTTYLSATLADIRTLRVTNNQTVGGNLSVSGTSLFGGLLTAQHVSLTGNQTVAGNAAFGGDVRIAGNLYVSGSQSIDGVLFANGGIALSGTVTSGNVSTTYLSATLADIRTLRGNAITYTSATFNTAVVAQATLTNVSVTVADIDTLRSTLATLATLNATQANLTNISGTRVDVAQVLRVSGTTYVQDINVLGNLNVSGSQRIDGVLFANGGIALSGTVTSGNISATNLSATVADIRTLRVTNNQTVGGGVSVTGNVQANTFIGSGASLTDIPASAVVGLNLDRISTSGVSSGANLAMVVADQGTVSFTLAGNPGRAYLDSTLGLVAPGVSTTGPISGTVGYFSGGVSVSQLGLQSGATPRLLVAPSGGAGVLFQNLAASGNFIFRNNAGGTLANMDFATNRVGLNTGTATPSATLHVSGTLRISNAGEACDADRVGAIRYSGSDFSVCRNGTAWETLTSIAQGAAGLADRISSGTTQLVVVSNTGFVSLTQAGTNTGWFDPTRGLVTLGVSATGTVSATAGFLAGPLQISQTVNTNLGGITIGVSSSSVATGYFYANGANNLEVRLGGTNGQFQVLTTGGTRIFQVNDSFDYTNMLYPLLIGGNNTTPVVALQVSGTLRVANGGEACDASRTGAMRFTGGDFSVCRNGSSWESLTSIAQGAAGLADRISSGTTQLVVVSNTGFVSLTQAGTNTGWFDPTRGLVTLGVSATGGISGTTGYFAGNVGIGITNPGLKLDVAGDIRATLGNVWVSNGAGYVWGDATTYVGGDASTDYVNVITSGTERLRITAGGNVGVGIVAPAISLTVVGEVQVSNSGVLCGGTTAGAIRYSGGTLSFCNGSVWTALGTAGSADWYGITNIPTQVQNVSNGTTLSMTWVSSTNLSATSAQISNLSAGAIATNSVSSGLISASNISGSFAQLSRISSTNVSITSNLTVGGTVTAGAFVGDGSGLTNLSVSGDRITSGTTSVVAQNNSAVSITIAGSNVANFGSGGLGITNINASGAVSVTGTGYFSGSVGVGMAPSDTQALSVNTSATSSGLAIHYQGSASPVYYLGAGSAGAGTLRLAAAGNSFAINNSANQAFVRFLGSNSAMLVGTGVSTASQTLHVNGSALITSWTAMNFGTGTRVTATAPLEVSGTISATTLKTGPGESCASSADAGAIRYSGGALSFCNGSTWTTLGTAGSADWYGITNIPTQVQNVSNGTTLSMSLVSATNISGSFAQLTRISSTNVSITNNLTVGGFTQLGNVSVTNISATGNIQANRFIGDGSGLTGVVAAATDRITSGTTQMVVVSNTGFVSLTQAGTNTGWFDPTRGLVTLGVSSTGTISGTAGYFAGNVGIGTTSPVAMLDVRGNLRVQGSGTTVFNFRDTFASSNYGTWANAVGSPIAYIGGALGAVISGGTANDFAIRAPNGNLILWSDGTNNVGVNTLTPATRLDVNGSIRIADGGEACDGTRPGAIRYSGGALSFCNGSIWTTLGSAGSADWYGITNIPTQVANVSNGTTLSMSLVSASNISGTLAQINRVSSTNISATNISTTRLTVNGVDITGGGGATRLASLTDVSLSNLTGLDILRYNGTSWTNVNVQNAISTTTMYSNWPDAIACDDAGTMRIMTLWVQSASGATYVWPHAVNFYYISYSSSGNYSSQVGTPTWDCVTNAWSIGQLYTAGRAFNFIGGSGTTSPTVDRIISGTSNAIVNSATGVISFTQLGTATAYLHPTLGLVAPGVSTTGGISGTTGYFTGNVGIGTTSPAYKLDIFGAVDPVVRIKATGTGSAWLVLEPTVTGDGIIHNPTSQSTVLTTNGVERVRITVAGDVGVSTASPATRLDVNGTIRIGNGGEVCNGTRPGAIRYSGGALSFCNGSVWTTLGSAGSADWYGITNIPTQVQNVSNGTVISMSHVSATNVSASALQLGGTGTCTVATAGMMRYTDIGGGVMKLQLCRP